MIRRTRGNICLCKTVFAGHDSIVSNMNLIVVVTSCTRPAKDQASQNFSILERGAHEAPHTI